MHVCRSAAVVTLLAVPLSAQTPSDLLSELKNPEPRARRLAAEALGKRQVEAAIPALAGLLRDGDAGVRSAAAEALGRMGPKGAAALGENLKSPEQSTRLTAARALMSMGPPAKGALPALTAALKDADVDVRIHAARALGSLAADAKPALPALFEAAADTGHLGGIMRPTLPSSVAEAAID